MHPLDNPVWQSLDTRQAGAGDAPAALVYPHYLRPRTPDMGRYIGIYDGSRLAAMAGERLGCVQRIDINLWSLK